MLTERDPKAFDLDAPDAAEQMAQGRLHSRALGAVGIISAIIAFLPLEALDDARDFAIWLAIITPVMGLTLYLKGRGLYQLDSNKHDPRPSVLFCTLVPSAVLGMLAMREHVMAPGNLLWPLGFVAAGCAITAYMKPDESLGTGRRLSIAFTIAMSVFAWSAGAGVLINCRYDRSEPQTHQVRLLTRFSSRGSKSTTYYWTLSAWGPFRDNERFTVQPAEYRRAEPGAQIRVEVRRGLLGLEWFEFVP
ncbi:MAG: hypothetical protein JST92_15025 [Deltaproteobacteria bacterium]|nr:hypothetical protein [Deltaproteobacteria bacterium]